MKQEDYVTIEVAKLLKEKGYNEKCSSLYLSNATFIEDMYSCKDFEKKIENGFYDAPILSQAAKWLREEHNIHIDVRVGWTSWMFDIYTIDSLHHFDVEDNREYSSYEEALNKGIKEALKII